VFEAVRGACADAGLAIKEVDGWNVSCGMPPAIISPYQFLDGGPAWSGNAPGGIDAVLEAAAAIRDGRCDAVVIATGQTGAHADHQSTAPWTRPPNEFVEPWGLYTAAEFALVAQRHMHTFGTTSEQLAEVASCIRTHGSMNPEAVFYSKGPITPEQVLASPMIAFPYRLLDCAMTSEGAVAVVLTAVERARALASLPVHILGGATESRGEMYTRAPVFDEVGWVGSWAAEKAFATSGCAPADVSCCELYDNFSFEVIHQLEAFGFCEKGEGGPFVMDGRLRLGGELPVCTDGGLMSFSHIGLGAPLQRVVAATTQLRGMAGPRQVPDAEVALVSDLGLMCRGVMILGNERPA
jgi:acetyl-CoA acetyltransferase